MRWLRLYIPTFLALALSACVLTPADLEGLTPTEKVYVLKQDFSNKLDVVLRYANQPPCSAVRIVACSDDAVVDALYALALQVDLALDLAGERLDDTQLELARFAYTNLVNELLRRQLIEVTQ